MVELFLGLLIGLIAVGIVVTMLRDGVGRGYRAGYQRRPGRTGPFGRETSSATRPPGGLYEDEQRIAERRRIAPRAAARAVPAATRDGTGNRGALLLSVAALGATAGLLLIVVARSRDGSDAAPIGMSEEGPGGGAAATSAATATAPAGSASRALTATPATTRTGTPPPANAVTLAVEARQQANVRVTVDGRTEFEGVLRAGESRSWAGSARVQLWTDNGRNVVVAVNGSDLGPLSTAVGHPDWNTVDWGWAAGWRP